MRKAFRIGGYLLAALAAVLAGAALYIQSSGIPRYPLEKVDFRVDATPERVVRGRRVVTVMCAACHLDPATGLLSGRRMPDVPPEFGVAYSRNITRHPQRGIGAWTDGEIAYLIRTGIRRDGQYTPPWMPKLPLLSDEDLRDLIAFLRSDDPMVQPSEAANQESEPSFLTKLLTRTAFKPLPYPGRPVVAPDPGDPVAFGRYLVQGRLGCYGCHSADFKTVDDMEPEKSGGYLGGGNGLYVGGETILTANITPDPETGIGSWTVEDFRRTLQRGVRPDKTLVRYPMEIYSELEEQEVDAIFAYLRTVPPLRNAVARSPGRTAAAGASRGKQAYYENGCYSCHGDTGVGVYSLLKGPSDFPTDAELTAYIRDPLRFKPGIKMPTFDGVIAEDDYVPLAAYVRELVAASPAGRK
jgi:mono/diheme cytochrome c family protein